MKHRTASMVPLPPDDIENPECIGTFMSVTWDEKTEKAPPDHVMKQVREVCESEAMKEFCARAGVHGVSFEWNENNEGAGRFFRRQSNVSTKFWKSYETSVKKALHLPHQKEQFIRFFDAYKHDESLKRMAIVFHGTPEERIPEILDNGLDPRYRKTQAFGKGEYFSKEPGLATTYCQGGHKLVVYLVFLPDENEKYYSQKDRDIVVVNNISHELPIGVITFESRDRKVIQHTQDLRIEQKELKVVAIEKEKQLKKAHEDGAPEDVIQKLDDEVHEAWDDYFHIKFDDKRNLLEHLHVSPVALHH